ncbi:MAG: pyridoxine 5'-phosphate synthase [Proteobacteria bacterium]|nr:pyridoxine 5'-phosphate synthase [Pseudomonadota bacterium]
MTGNNLKAPSLRLGVNIDHVATIRNARGGRHPDPVRAAHLAVAAGADGITAHLREDRRHISDEDIARLKSEITQPLNLEMAMTDEMLEIALKHIPNACCLVPERRREITTEGGLDAAGKGNRLPGFIGHLKDKGIRVSLFIDPNPHQIEASASVGADIVELHAGAYCEAILHGNRADIAREINRLAECASAAAAAGLEVHAGHGLTFDSVDAVAAMPEIVELNIGHFLIGEAIFGGLHSTIRRMRALMDNARAQATGSASA